MITEAFVADIFFERGDDASPTEFTRVCQIFSISGVGETNELINATTFCSGGNREYIAGLADGSEITLEANYEKGPATALSTLIDDVKNRRTGPYQVVVGDPVVSETFSFNAVAIGWELAPNVEDRNTIMYTLKISGPITIA
jgi:hypothetical protein